MYVVCERRCEYHEYQTSGAFCYICSIPLELELCTFFNTIARDTSGYAYVVIVTL